MEIDPGVFLSSTSTDDWQPDPEVGGEMHIVVQREDAFVGMTRYRDAPDGIPWTLPERETVLILEGAARIEIDGGPTLDLKVGDIASIPKGATTTWHVSAPFRELWFFPRAYDPGSE